MAINVENMFDGGDVENVAKRSLDAVRKALESDPALVKELGAVFGFAIKPGAFKLGETPADATSGVYKTFVLDCSGKKNSKILSEFVPTEKEKTPKNVQLTFAIHELDWNDILTPPANPPEGFTGGTLDPIAAFMGGLMWLDGDIALAMKLPAIVNLARGMEIKRKAA